MAAVEKEMASSRAPFFSDSISRTLPTRPTSSRAVEHHTNSMDP
jgi:hypothetical protein